MTNPSPGQKIRPSAIAGAWYPGTASKLAQTVDEFLAKAPIPPVSGRLLGLIAPHAGYVYSGQVAAYAYRQLKGLHFDTVAVISPLHRTYAGHFVTSGCSFYETPLGLVEIDADRVEALSDRLPLSYLQSDDEHSLEIQLPFLQRTLGDFKLIPVMQGDQSLAASEVLSAALADVLTGQQALLVASTDLSHFYPYERAVRLDRTVVDYINSYDPTGLNAALERGTVEACGGGPVVAAMLAARVLGADRARVLHYANSGDVTGDRSRVVGYLAGMIYQAA